MRSEKPHKRWQSHLDGAMEKESQEKLVRGGDGVFKEPARGLGMDLYHEIALSNKLDIHCIEEVYPCTPMQNGLLSLASRRSGDYVMNAVLALSPSISLAAFSNAWATVIERMGILRTRFVHHNRLGILQVVLNEVFSWDEGDDLETQLQKHKKLDLGFGKRLSHYSLVKEGNGKLWFIWTIHHALYDGWLLSRITQNVSYVYGGVACQKQHSFASFVEYTQRQDNDRALEYWRSTLMGFEGAPFPTCLHTSIQQARQCTKIAIQPSPLANQGTGFRDSTLINAAWALVTSRHAATDDVVFGTIVSGRSRHIPLTIDTAGPTIATIPLRIKICSTADVMIYLTTVETASVQRRGHEHIGLHKISGASANSEQACRFQTLLILHPTENDLQMDLNIGHWKTGSKDFVPHTYALTIQCFRTETALKVQADFDSDVLAPWMVKHMLGQFTWVLRQLVESNPSSRVSDLEVLHPADLEQVWRWNATVPPRVDRCVHDLIAEQARMQPEAEAVCAWDGNLTYQQLDDLATQLAIRLLDLGVKQETLVPLCFEKSMWTSVAVLAVLKAGGAFVLLDITQPAARLAAVVAQIEPRIMLMSTSYTTLDIPSDCIALSIGHTSSIFDGHQHPTSCLKQICPTSDAYVIFTSGSTGKPKGVRVQHHALASSCYYHGANIGFNANSRVFQFTSYSFDVVIMELITTLVHGGCVCVPSAGERMNQLGGSMKRLKVNTAFLTPSVSRLVNPEEISLETILIGGDISREEDFRRWSHLPKVMHVYGPTECTIFSCLNPQGLDFHYKNCIGWAIGSVNWIVDIRDSQRLAPLGAVGELLIEGPIVGRGYLNDPVRTAEVFIQDPAWLTQGGGPGYPGRRGRLYKTGDLVQYNEDGSLTYVGRTDTQVKIRGQRVELGDIEHHIRESLPEVRQVATEVVMCVGEDARPTLVAFLQEVDIVPAEQEALQAAGLSARLYNLPPAADERLREQLPAYMVPTIYFALGQLPITPSGKMDRKKLRSFAGSFSASKLAAIQTTSASSRRPPSTEAERILQHLWARMLNIDSDQIGLDDNFFHLGGDSIAAMKLAGEAQIEGMAISVADIFRYPKLERAATLGFIDGNTTDDDVAAFSLLGDAVDSAACCNQIAETYGLDIACIEDAYPCTPLQEGLLALSLKTPGDYILQDVLELSPSIHIDRFRTAWEQVVQATPILRTRFLQHSDLGLLQVVLAGDVQWTEGDDLELCLRQDLDLQMEHGQPLARYRLIRDSVAGRAWFLWTIHHALYDGVSMPLLLDHVSRAYHGISFGVCPEFKNFVRYIKDRDMNAAEAYWRGVFEGYDATIFPPLPPSRREPAPDSEIVHICPLRPVAKSRTTLASIIRAAWALVMWQYSGSTDVAFGAIISGRSAPVRGIAHIVGPTIATVPIRIQVATDETLECFVAKVQAQATGMIPYEQTGLRRISAVSESAERACGFQTLLVLQPLQEEPPASRSLGSWQRRSHAQAFMTYSLTVTCQLSGNGDGNEEGVAVQANFDSGVLAPWMVKRMLGQFAWILQQLVESKPGSTVSDLEILHPADRKQVWRWNATVPPRVDRCVHDLIAEQARMQPEAEAVCAWDGNLTYQQLDDLATRLAIRLVGRGVGPETLVPLCFEKSMWTNVAVLAVLKAGGTFVLLDIAQPAARLAAVVAQIGANILLSSVAAHPLSVSLVQEVIPVGPGTISLGKSIDQARLPCVDPSVTMYAVFTSGSTGTPKGVLISHSSFSSALHHQLQTLLFSARSRHFDFMSYTFDVAIHNTLATFAAGGCLCVPSEEARKNGLANAIVLSKANSASLTPSVARLLDPELLVSLKSLILIGEALTRDDVQTWRNIRLINGYGPAECTPYATAQHMFASTASEVSIGKGMGAVTWVVNADNHERLTPIGAVGELLIEGPIVGRGYLNDLVRTADVFIEDPIWLTQGSEPGHTGRRGRLYKTGDLVRYNEDGSLVYVGRKDTQVKIRGQRVELGEVEHYLRESLPEVRQVAAEVVAYAGHDTRPTLMAFLEGVEGVDMVDMAPAEQKVLQAAGLSARVYNLPPAVDKKLRGRLPAYMVPTIYFMLRQLPITPSGKMDRKQLRSFAGSFSAPELAAIQTTSVGSKRLPATEAERILQHLWARVLNIDSGRIGLDDNFFHLGGDSISGMHLVGLSRSQGLFLTLEDVFQYSQLQGLAAALRQDDCPVIVNQSPYSLVTNGDPGEFLRENVLPFLPPTTPGISDTLPVTDFQRYCVGNELEPVSPTRHYFYLDYPPHTPDSVLYSSCSMLSTCFDALRVIFFQSGSMILQASPVELSLPVDYHKTSDRSISTLFEQVCTKDLSCALPLGQPFTRFLILRSQNALRLVLRLSHAQYDGMSLAYIARALGEHYQGISQPPAQTFASYLYYCNANKMRRYDYWSSVLKDSQVTMLVKKKSCTSDSDDQIRLEGRFPVLQSQFDVTPATIFTAACAAALAKATGCLDVVFGRLVSGRGGLPPAFQDVVGPCVNTVPVRARFSDTVEMQDVLQTIQRQYVQSTPYEAISLNELAHHCTDWAGWGLVSQYQNIDEKPIACLGSSEARLGCLERPEQRMQSRTILVSATLDNGSLKLSVTACSLYHDEGEIAKLYHTLRSLLLSLPKHD